MAAGVFSGILMIVGMLVLDLGIVCTAVRAVTMGIAMVVINRKVKETKGADLKTAGT